MAAKSLDERQMWSKYCETIELYLKHRRLTGYASKRDVKLLQYVHNDFKLSLYKVQSNNSARIPQLR